MLVIFGRCVCHIDFGKIGVVCTFVTLKFFSTIFVNNLLCNIKGRFQVRIVDYGKAVKRWITLCDIVVWDNRAVGLFVKDYAYRNTIVVFLFNILFKLIRTCVFNALTNSTVCVQIVNSADRFRLHRIFLALGNKVIYLAFSVFKSRDSNIKTSVGQHCHIGFHSVFRNTEHRYSFIVANRSGSHPKVKYICGFLCIIVVALKEVAHLIEYKAVRVLGFYRKITSIWFTHSVVFNGNAVMLGQFRKVL